MTDGVRLFYTSHAKNEPVNLGDHIKFCRKEISQLLAPKKNTIGVASSAAGTKANTIYLFAVYSTTLSVILSYERTASNGRFMM